MLYEVYQNKIQKIARIFAFIKKHAVIFILATITVIGAVSALCVTKGMVGEFRCSEEYVYGEKLKFSANAFLSDVRYEYKAEDGTWSGEAPFLPGEYTVRAVGTSIFGSKRYSGEQQFTIVSKSITVAVSENSLIYGEQPSVLAEVVAKDRIVCDGYTYQNILDKTTAVWPNENDICITNEAGIDVTAAYSITIEKKDVTILPRDITVTVADSSKEYDGIQLSFDQYEISDGTLAKKDVLQATFTAELIEVGSVVNEPSLQILNQNGNDVTHHYAIKEVFGSLTVEKRPLIAISGSMSLTYDGKEHSNEDITVSDDTSLVNGHSLQIEEFAKVKDAGTHENLMILSVLDGEGNPKTENYSIFVQNGIIEILPKDITFVSEDQTWMYDGEEHGNQNVAKDGLLQDHSSIYDFKNTIQNCGSVQNEFTATIFDENGVNVSNNYKITYTYGTLTVNRRPIVIQPAEASKVYDGSPLFCHDYYILSEYGIVDSHELIVHKSKELVNVGKVLNEFLEYSILDAQGEDVISNYDITEQYKLFLEITPRPIILQPEYVSQYYCGADVVAKNVIVSRNSYYKLVSGHTVEATFIGSSFDVTEKPVETKLSNIIIWDKNLNNVTNNYSITQESGSLVVRKRPILIVANQVFKIYDGTPLTAEEASIDVRPVNPLTEGLVNNDYIYKITLNGSQTDVGNSLITLSGDVTIMSTQLRDVTHNYDINFEGQSLIVKPRPITVQSGSAEKVYDGKPLVCHDPIKIIEGSLVLDHKLDMEAIGTITEVGVAPNDIKGKIKTGKNKDVTSNYEITKDCGTLRIIAPNGGGNISNVEDMNTVIMRIKSEYSSKIYLRLMSFGDYIGNEWMQGKEYGQLLDGQYSYNYLPGITLENANINKATLLVQSFTNDYLLPYHLALSHVGYDVQTSDVTYTGNGMTEYSVPYYVYSGLGTEYRGLLGSPYNEYELAYREFVCQNYLTVDYKTKSYMKTIIEQNGFSASDPYVYQKVASYIQNAAKYNLNYDRALDSETNVVISFLSQYKEGICVHYASAATLLFRSLGIPARYVVGYTADTIAGQWTEVKTPGHAWTEVYIDGIGWMPIEVTGFSDGNGSGVDNGKQTIQITPAYQSKVYDGTPLVAQNQLEGSSELLALLHAGYKYTVEVEGQRTDVGKGISTIKSFILYDPDGNDVTDMYNIYYNQGTLEVFVSDTNIVKVYLYRLQKYYDGTPLRYTDEDYAVVSIDNGMSLKLELNIELTAVGYLTLSDLNQNIDYYANYHIYKNGVDITDNCKLIFVSLDGSEDNYIPISVDKRPIELTANSGSKVYDGTPLMSTGITVSKGTFADNQQLDNVIVIGNITSVGTTTCSISPASIIIKDSEGIDVTSNYDIKIIDGTLTVIPKPNKFD